MKSFFVLFFTVLTLASMAQTSPSSRSLVHVTGEGKVTVTPDQVSIKVRVEHQGKDAVTVKNQNDVAINAVIKFLRGQGIENSDVQTEYINLNKNYEYNTKTYNYTANQALTILLKDLSKYEAIMSGLLNSGINRIDGVQFKSSKATSLKEEARIKAMTDAKQRAVTYASALGQSIGKAVEISEQGSNVPQPQFRRALSAEASFDGGGETIAPGELTILVRVAVSFELN